MTHLLVLMSSITSKTSVIDKPFRYSHHQRVVGLIFDAVIIIGFITWGALVAYYNFGPPSKRRAAASQQ
jgi:uncharacterized BrkB/YihY/UPF0761 family membrane protein